MKKPFYNFLKPIADRMYREQMKKFDPSKVRFIEEVENSPQKKHLDFLVNQLKDNQELSSKTLFLHTPSK